MRILFLSRWFPFPASNGSKLRIYNLLCGLTQHHDVTLLSFVDDSTMEPDVSEIRRICSHVDVVSWRDFNPDSIRARLGLFSLEPRFLIDTFSPEMAFRITELLSKQSYDLVIASQLSMASYRSYFKGIPAVFEEVEIGTYYDGIHVGNLRERFRNTLTWFKHRAYLSQLLNSFQMCTVASEREKQLLTAHLSLRNGCVGFVPNFIVMSEYENYRTEQMPNQLIFSGSFRYYANYEAIVWYIEKVHPLVLKEIKDAHLIITGDHANLPLPESKNVTLSGYVDDIKSSISSSCASIVPLLTGGGTRLKILEAMAIGTPVISTTKGAEGLMIRNGEHLFIADEPQEFAECIVRVLRDTELSKQISSNAQRFVREKYDLSVVMPRFLRLVDEVIAG
jgi:polysaccharide biosynthesis protein PslH